MSIENQTGNKSTSCKSAHDADSTFFSIINIDVIIIKNTIIDQTESESEFSTASQSSGRTDNISIAKSNENRTKRHKYFERSILSTWNQEWNKDHDEQVAIELRLEEQKKQVLQGLSIHTSSIPDH